MEIVQYLQAHSLFFLVYVFFAWGMLVEGLLFALTVMFLVTTNVVEVWPAMISVAVGAMLEQWLLYHTGTRLNGYPRITGWVNRIAQRFDDHIKQRTLRTLIISKFIYGIHRAILIRSGMLQLPRARFLKASLVSTAFWLLVIGVFSYYFSGSLLKLTKYTNWWVNILPIILIAVFLLAEKLVGKYLRRWL